MFYQIWRTPVGGLEFSLFHGPLWTSKTISIQTAGLAFGGTGLCSYRVRALMAVMQSI